MGCFNSKDDVFAPPPQQPWQPYAPQQHHAAAAARPTPMPPSMPIVPPFMRMACPGGMPWFEYVAGAPIEVDPSTGFLAGRWAECLCWAIRLEHSCHWQSLPEYACGDAPAGGVLEALEQALGGPHSVYARERLEAASRLEEAAHHAAEHGQPLPVIDGPCAMPAAAAAPCASVPEYGHPAWGGPPPGCGAPGYGMEYSHHGGLYQGGPQHGGPYQGGPPYGSAWEQGPAGGPTLLESRPQNQGMGTGGKMALAAAGGVAAGVAGYALATHLDDVGDAIGQGVEGVGDFAGAAFEGVGDFAGAAFGGVEDFVEDIF